MRVLILSQHFWPESFRINDVAGSLVAAGHEVSILTGQPNYPGGHVYPGYRAAGTGVEQWKGMSIYRVPLVPRGRGSSLRLVANYISFIVSACLVGAWQLRRQHFDVIFVYGTSPILQALAGIVLARIKNCRLVTWIQDLWPESLEATGYVRNQKVLQAVASVVRWIYRRNDLLLVQSKAFVPLVTEMSGGVPVKYHPNPSEASGVSATGEPVLKLPPGFNIVFAGNLGTAQSLDTIISAAANLQEELPDVRFVLVGSGQRSDWVAAQIVRRRIKNVLMPGRYAPDEMPAIFEQADALLVTLVKSPIMRLTVPSKIQTYLAAGRPILAAVDGEGAELIRQAGAGIASPAEDPDALAGSIRDMYRMSHIQRAEMGKSGRRFHDAHYGPEDLTRQLALHLQF